MVHSEVYLNKYVASIAPFSTPACRDCSQNIQKTDLFCVFSLFNFSSIFPRGSADLICLYVRTPMPSVAFSGHLPNLGLGLPQVECLGVMAVCRVQLRTTQPTGLILYSGQRGHEHDGDTDDQLGVSTTDFIAIELVDGRLRPRDAVLLSRPGNESRVQNR